jgi:hypothetical protein
MTKKKTLLTFTAFLLCSGLFVSSCDLNSPVSATYDFINHFGAARIQSVAFVAYRFYENFGQGKITPSTTTAITPNGKPVFPLAQADVGGVRGPSIVMIAPAEIAFEDIRVQYGAWLEFGVGQMFRDGDGVLASLIVEAAGKRDTLYRRYFHARENAADRQWFYQSVSLAAYEGKAATIIFAAGTGPAGNNLGDFVAWQSPVLMQSRTEETPTRLGAFVMKGWEIGGSQRDAIITLAGSFASFDLPATREGEVLYFGVGMKFLVGDGAQGLIICEVEGRRDTLYRRFLSPATRPSDRRWFDEAIVLSSYRGRDIRLTFAATPGPVDEYTADWFAWSTPVLTLPRR